MNVQPHIQFYKSIFPFVALSALIGIVFSGILYGFLLFLTVGLGFGFLGFHTFYKEQWYAYQNLGLTKWDLCKTSFLLNLCLGAPVFLILYLLISFFIGDFSLT